ncbi:MAG: glycosyltransferase [Desulfovibrio sp.]|nr:glycosyltransferase [Desulfovibrio sp.]
MRRPCVSVVMNCYNSARYLEEALISLLRQSFEDFEIIFWDNASTDDSAAIARKMRAQSIGRLRYFRGQTTVPLGVARNLALARARGEHVAFLDCDDLWRPQKLAKQMALFAANPRLGLVCTDTELLEGKRVLKRQFAEAKPARGVVFAQLMERQWISMSSAMARAEALVAVSAREASGGAFDESLNVCEEADLFYRIAHDWEVDFVDEPLTVWRVHSGNTTFRRFGQFADETLYILDKHRRLYPGYDTEHSSLVALLTRRAAFQKAVSLWREGEGREARAVIAPWRKFFLKHRLFWWASFLPGICFDFAARLYFALPARLRN